VAVNRAVSPLRTDVGPELLQPPVNVLGLSLQPVGLAPRIVNLAQWREHILTRLNRQVEVTADRVLADLLVELRHYPSGCKSRDTAGARELGGVVVPLQINSASGVLSFLSTTTVFGTPVNIALSELAIESFFPAGAAAAEIMRRLAVA
jgi:hypothetical protein